MNKKRKINIEVEIRGPLSNSRFNNFFNFLEKEATSLHQGLQDVFMFQENLNLNIEKDKLRIVKTNKVNKICLKISKSHDSNEEIEFFLKDGEHKKAINFFKHIGFSKHSKVSAERYDFLYQNIQISLKKKCIIGLHYEMEILVNRDNDILQARRSLLKLAKEFDLKVWSDEEYKKHRSQKWEIYRNKKKNKQK